MLCVIIFGTWKSSWVKVIAFFHNFYQLRQLTAAVRDLQQIVLIFEGKQSDQEEKSQYGIVRMPEMQRLLTPAMDGDDE